MDLTASQESDVALIWWPEQRPNHDGLIARGQPCLLLVAPDSPPPVCRNCLEDWIRMPSDDGDVRARILALLEHRRAHLKLPAIDEYGVVRAAGKMVFLSPREQRLAEALLARFGAVVEEAELRRNVFDPDDYARNGTLRICVSRLRKRLAPLGLTISCVRTTGYLLHHAESTHASPPSPGPWGDEQILTRDIAHPVSPTGLGHRSSYGTFGDLHP